MTEPPGDAQFPQYPQDSQSADESASQSSLSPARPIRASRVWIGIGIASAGHMIAVCLGFALSGTGLGGTALAGIGLFLPEVLLFIACLAVGIYFVARRDRGIGVGLLSGWAAGAIILAGVCVALIAVIAASLGG